MELKDPDLLAALMASRKLSGRELSDRIGWKSHTYLQRLLRGEVKTLDADRAIAIALNLGVSTDVLFVPKVARINGQPGQSNRKKESAA